MMPSLQLRMLYSLVTIGIIYVTAMSALVLMGDDFDRETGRIRCPFIRNSLINGKVRIRARGRIAKFTCKSGYHMVGQRFATCIRGEWNNPVPICVTNGCPVINNPANGQMNVQIIDSLVAFSCDPGYILKGSHLVYCNGVVWNDTIPNCDIATSSPELGCDFEDSNICGWTHDRYDDFDWRRHQFSTPSGHVGTGPSYDHTLGRNNDGHYMYIEASSPRKENDSARLFSPVYFPESTPGCFVFWYHMYGATTGSLRVFLKKESQVLTELLPVWEKSGQQGNLWLQGDLSIPELKEHFQIVIEGIRGSSYVADTAIDDVALYNTPCEDLVLSNITRGADSCQQRCFSDDDNSTCSCKQECEKTLTCCDDFQYFCTDSVGKTDVGLFSIEPSPKPLSTSIELPPSSTASDTATTIERQFPISSRFPVVEVFETTVTISPKSSSNVDQTSNIINQTSTKIPFSTLVTTSALSTNETIPLLAFPSRNLTSMSTAISFSKTSPDINAGNVTNKQMEDSTVNQVTTIPPIKTTSTETIQVKKYSTAQPMSTKKIIIPSTAKTNTETIQMKQYTTAQPVSTNQVFIPSTAKTNTKTIQKYTTAASTERKIIPSTAKANTETIQIKKYTTARPISTYQVIIPSSIAKTSATSSINPVTSSKSSSKTLSFEATRSSTSKITSTPNLFAKITTNIMTPSILTSIPTTIPPTTSKRVIPFTVSISLPPLKRTSTSPVTTSTQRITHWYYTTARKPSTSVTPETRTATTNRMYSTKRSSRFFPIYSTKRSSGLFPTYSTKGGYRLFPTYSTKRSSRLFPTYSTKGSSTLFPNYSTTGSSRLSSSRKPDLFSRTIPTTSTYSFYFQTTRKYTSPATTTNTNNNMTFQMTNSTTLRSFEKKTIFWNSKPNQHPVASTTHSIPQKFNFTHSSTPKIIPNKTSQVLFKQLTTNITDSNLSSRNTFKAVVLTTESMDKNTSSSYTTRNVLRSSIITNENNITTSIPEINDTMIHTKLPSHRSQTSTSSIPDQKSREANKPPSIPSGTVINSIYPTESSFETIEVMTTWSPDFKLRTKYRIGQHVPTKKPSVSTTIIVAIALSSISALALILVVVFYIFCRKRNLAQNKLSDDSEMRFLSDNEIAEFVDASSNLNPVRIE